MDVSMAEAKNRLPELIRAMEAGKKIVITRHGKAVAQLSPAPAERRAVQLGAMNGNSYVVLGGLKPGEKLIVSGIQKIGDGAPVQAAAPAPPAASSSQGAR